MAPRKAASIAPPALHSGAPPQPSEPFAWTGAMTIAFTNCPEAEQPCLQLLFRLLGTIPVRPRNDLLRVYGMDGDSLKSPREPRDMWRDLGCDSPALADRHITDLFKRIQRTQRPDGLPPEKGRSWLRDLIHTIQRNMHELGTPGSQNPPTPARSAGRDVPAPQGNGTQLQVIEQNIIGRCTSDGDKQYFFLLFAKLKQLYAPKHLEMFFFRYGMDDRNLLLRSWGRFTERFRKFRNEKEAESRIHGMWHDLHQHGLIRDVNETWLLAALSHIRSPHAPPPDPARGIAPERPAPQPDPPPDPASPRGDPNPPDASSDMPDEEDMRFFLARCVDDIEREFVTFMFTHLPMVRERLRPLAIQYYGMRRTTPPVPGATLSQQHGKSAGWVTVMLAPELARLRSLDGSPDVKGMKFHNLMDRLHRHEPLPPAPPSPDPGQNGADAAKPDAPPQSGSRAGDGSTPPNSSGGGTSEPPAPAARESDRRGTGASAPGRLEGAAHGAERTPASPAVCPGQSRGAIGMRPNIAEAIRALEAFRSFWLAASSLLTPHELDVLKMYYDQKIPVGTIAKHFGVSMEDMWREIRAIKEKLGITEG